MNTCTLLLLMLTAGFAFAELPESRKDQIAKELVTDMHLDVQKFSQEERAWIEDWILNLKVKEPGVDEENFHRHLIQLGHRPTITKYAEPITRGVTPVYVLNAHQPRLIQYYESQLSINEPAWAAQISDHTIWRASVSAAYQILRNLAGSNEVPANVRQWARELYALVDTLGSDDPKSRKGLEESRSIVRQWWTENKQVVVEERFSEVKPGEIHSFILEKRSKPEPIAPAESVLKRPEHSVANSSTPITAQEAAEAAKEGEGSNWFWIVPAVCVALGVGLFVGFRKKA